MATSTITEPGFIASTICRVTSFGAAAPGISTPPITRSARSTCCSTLSAVGKDGHHARPEQAIHAPQDVDVAVDDHHLSATADGDLRRVGADDAATENDDPR
jgi:hypothetical protein